MYAGFFFFFLPCHKTLFLFAQVLRLLRWKCIIKRENSTISHVKYVCIVIVVIPLALLAKLQLHLIRDKLLYSFKHYGKV